MNAQDNPNGPVRSQLDPERDTKAYPGKWDLSSLPQPTHPPLNGTEHGQAPAEPSAMSTSATSTSEPGRTDLPQRYAEMQIDPFLDEDEDTPESCWGRQI